MMSPPPGTQLLPLVIAVKCPVCDHALLAAAIVCDANALSALNAGSSDTLPSAFVQALDTVHITVPLVFDPDAYSILIYGCPDAPVSQSCGSCIRH
jgi:hypothetical protein